MIYLVLLVGLFLRLISLSQSLWLDEAINIIAVKNNNLFNLITEYTKFDFHPPGYFILLWVWTKLFGYSELSVRLPSVIFGQITIYLIYLIGQRLHSKRLGIIAAMLAAINPLAIYYSQEARMYAFAAMAVSLNVLYFINLLNEKKIYFQGGYVLSLILVLFSDYLTYFIIPAQFLYLLWSKKRSELLLFLKLLFFGLISWIWWVFFLIIQINSGLNTAKQVPVWREVVGGFGIKPLILTYVKFIIGRISYPDSRVYFILFLPLGLLFAYLFIRGLLKFQLENRVMLMILFFVPLVLSWGFSAFVPIFSYFRVLYLLVPFLLIIGLGIVSFGTKLSNFLLGIVFLIEVSCSGTYLVSPSFQREDWQSLATFLINQDRQIPLLIESNGNFAPLQYYSTNKLTTDDQIKPLAGFKNFPAKEQNDLADLDQKLSGKNQILLLNYLADVADPNRILSNKLKKLGYSFTKVYNFNGVGFVYLYQK